MHGAYVVLYVPYELQSVLFCPRLGTAVMLLHARIPDVGRQGGKQNFDEGTYRYVHIRCGFTGTLIKACQVQGTGTMHVCMTPIYTGSEIKLNVSGFLKV